MIDLGTDYEISGFNYLPRQGGVNGRVRDYQFFVGDDINNWETAIASGTFGNTATEQTVLFNDSPGNSTLNSETIVSGLN